MFLEKKTIPPLSSERNVVGKNTSIVGDVKSEGDFRIDGSVEGTVKTAGRVVIGALGCVNGKIICDNADIEGTFSGELLVNNLLTLKATAKISGEVIISKLLVEPGAEFNATCTMKGSVMELKNGQPEQEKTA
ncbi:MAG: polymer-forming cytoskeletal protein [Flavobacteriaceae bacterium]|nr:polymer-forming cytoskeletal protein [Flavobacteriaceae bacterium]